VGGAVHLDGSNIFNNVEAGGVGDGGEIHITAGSLSLLNGAQLQTLVRQASETEAAGRGNAGNITLNIRDAVTLSGVNSDGKSSRLISELEAGAEGDAGDILVNTGSLFLSGENVAISSSTYGQGNAGNITLQVDGEVRLDGGNVFSVVESDAIGRGGDIQINAGSLLATNGAQLDVSTFGQGNAGNIIITAQDTVSFDGVSTDRRYPSAIFSLVDSNAEGNGGDIQISAGSFSINNGARLNTSTLGQGNAGDIIITAQDTVSLTGMSADGQFRSSIFSYVQSDAIGNGGVIRIDASSLSLTDGARLDASTYGQGDAGDIWLQADDAVSIANDSVIFNNVENGGEGNGGDIIITARSLLLSNVGELQAGIRGSQDTLPGGRGDSGSINITVRDAVRLNRGGIYGDVEAGGIGDGGDINLRAGSLLVSAGSEIRNNTAGEGDAGRIVMRINGPFSLRGDVRSTVDSTGIGQGGNIRIIAESLSLTNGGQLSVSTSGQGDAGNIQIEAQDSIVLDGWNNKDGDSSGIFAQTLAGAAGRGGDIDINTNSFRITHGATVNAQTLNAFPGGNITINANTFTAVDGGQVITSTDGGGNAGDITLNARNDITLSERDRTYGDRLRRFGRNGVETENAASGLFANTRPNATGNGGRITVNGTNLTLEDGAQISAESRGVGTSGDIRLNIFEQLQLTDSNIATTATRSSGGDISVNLDSDSGIILLRGDSDITTNSRGNGGNITLQGSGIVAFDDSDILARSQDARGGNIILAPFFGTTNSDADPPFDGNGQVDVNADGQLASGTITTPDTSFIPNSLSDLPESSIDSETLVANSCVVRSPRQAGRFIITGGGGLPQSPGIAPLSSYATGTVRSIPEETPTESQHWQPGDPIVEPQNAYRLEDGRVVLSRECAF
jgi:large exoprotein involved in heme utilization and adhesion